MRITLERLRTGIVLLAVALVGVIGVFLFFARYERRHLMRDLPARLGVQIQESADGFTLSKSTKVKTIFRARPPAPATPLTAAPAPIPASVRSM
jgi:lipopolysaccharide export system protein LptA